MSEEPAPIAWPPASPWRETVRLVASLLFVAAAVTFVFWSALHWHWQGWLFYGGGIAAFAFATWGFFFVSTILPRWERKLPAARVARGAPPWRAERRWSARGARTQSGAPHVGAVALFAIVLVVLPCLLWGVWMMLRYGRIVWIGAPLGLFVTLLAVRAWLRGRVRVQWDAVPVATGRRARFVLSMTAGSSVLSGVRVRLRCVRTSEQTLTSHPEPWVLLRIEPQPGAPTSIDTETDAIFEFDIPADATGTDLRSAAPTHWDLAIWGRTGWGGFSGSVIVPVYAVPS